MANVLCSRARLVCYLPELHVLVHRVAGPRVLSAGAPSISYGSHVTLTPSDMGKHTVWHMGPSESNDQCVQLRRDVNHLEEEARQQSLAQKMVPELLFSSLGRERYESKVAHCITEFCEEDQTAFSLNRPEKYFHSSIVECAIQSCPDPLKQDLQCMFPDAPASCMTVVTVAQRTQNDMVAWSTQVEHERDQMLDKFVSGAKEICSALQREGFWADFIDPSSGLAFFGSYTNNTLFETDDRYRHLGFQIEDLGCCRVIRHALWGTHVFVGTIVTNSPPSSNIMKKLQES